MEEFEYGDWATYNGERVMIVDWTEDRSRVRIGNRATGEYRTFWVDREALSEIWPFMDTSRRV